MIGLRLDCGTIGRFFGVGCGGGRGRDGGWEFLMVGGGGEETVLPISEGGNGGGEWGE